MNDTHIERALEIGLGIMGALLLGGLGVLVSGRVGGHAVRAGRHDEEPPARGQVSPERHGHVASSSAR